MYALRGAEKIDMQIKEEKYYEKNNRQ